MKKELTRSSQLFNVLVWMVLTGIFAASAETVFKVAFAYLKAGVYEHGSLILIAALTVTITFVNLFMQTIREIITFTKLPKW